MATEGECHPQKVVVVGANGQKGLRVVEMLQKDPSYQPLAMIRTTQQAPRFDKLGVDWKVGDLELGTPTPSALEGADPETESVQRFLLFSGINADPLGTRRSINSKDLDGPLAAWHRLKAHSETCLKESHLHGRALDWTILCPGRLLDDEGGDTFNIKVSLIHGEEDLKHSLTKEEKAAAVKVLPGSHDGKSERLCVSRDNTAATLVGLLAAPNAIGKCVALADGILPVGKALKTL